MYELETGLTECYFCPAVLGDGIYFEPFVTYDLRTGALVHVALCRSCSELTFVSCDDIAHELAPTV